LGDRRIGSPDDVASEILASGEEILLVGDGAHRYHETFEGIAKVEVADAGLSYPSASSLVQLAHARALREQFERAADVEPLYLRKPDAEINWAVRDRSIPAGPR
jgi:tRNA threonylcarbamoyladenosine biosynthesis protein TsaB